MNTLDFILACVGVLALCWIAVSCTDMADELTRIRMLMGEDE